MNTIDYLQMYTLNPIIRGHRFRTSLNKLGEAASARNAFAIRHAIGHVPSGFGIPAAGIQLSSTGCCTWQPRPSPTPYRQFPTITWESILDSNSTLKAPKSSWLIHSDPQGLCLHGAMGCAACNLDNCRGEPYFFNDYHAAASLYARSSLRNKSMCGRS